MGANINSSLQNKFDGVDVLFDLLNMKTKLSFFMEKRFSIPGIKEYQILCFNPKRIPGERNTPETMKIGEVKIFLKRELLCIDIEVENSLKKSFEFKEDEVLDDFLKFMEKDADEAINDLIKAP